MGLDFNQYVLTRLSDTEHEHEHLLSNRIRFDGSVTSDSPDYRRHEALMRTIERDFNLQRVVSSFEVERYALTKGEIEAGLRTGLPSDRQQMQQLCDGAMVECRSFSEYARRLEAAGVALVSATQLAGAKLSGLSYRLEGGTMNKVSRQAALEAQAAARSINEAGRRMDLTHCLLALAILCTSCARRVAVCICCKGLLGESPERITSADSKVSTNAARAAPY